MGATYYVKTTGNDNTSTGKALLVATLADGHKAKLTPGSISRLNSDANSE